MSYLAQGLLSGFNQGFSAGTQAKRDKAMREERDADRAQRNMDRQIAQTRYEDQMVQTKFRQDIEDQRYADQQKIAADLRAEAAAQRKLDNDMRKTSYVDQRLDRTMDLARQTRQDFSAEVDKARLDPLKEARILEETRQLKLQNDMIGQPRETLVYDPLDPTGAPKRTVTGALGTLGAAAAQPDSASVAVSPQDRAAYEWAQKNPTDPRAIKILQRLGAAQ